MGTGNMRPRGYAWGANYLSSTQTPHGRMAARPSSKMPWEQEEVEMPPLVDTLAANAAKIEASCEDADDLGFTREMQALATSGVSVFDLINAATACVRTIEPDAARKDRDSLVSGLYSRDAATAPVTPSDVGRARGALMVVAALRRRHDWADMAKATFTALVMGLLASSHECADEARRRSRRTNRHARRHVTHAAIVARGGCIRPLRLPSSRSGTSMSGWPR